MKMQITVTLKEEDGSELTDPTIVEVKVPAVEAFVGPEVFDDVFYEYEQSVLEARNVAIGGATQKYLSAVAKKSPIGARCARGRTD